jgi:hypothetical protein
MERDKSWKYRSLPQQQQVHAVWFNEQRNIDLNNYYGCVYLLYPFTYPTS